MFQSAASFTNWLFHKLVMKFNEKVTSLTPWEDGLPPCGAMHQPLQSSPTKFGDDESTKEMNQQRCKNQI